MEIPNQLSFTVAEAAGMLGMDRAALRRMTQGDAAPLVPGRDWFDTSGRRPQRRITRVAVERLAGLSATAGAQ